MKNHIIYKWADIWEYIKDDANKKLLLGNGSSIAVAESFKYESIYEEANRAGRISENIKTLFEEFSTTDFEYVLRLLWETKTVNKILGINENKSSKLYTLLKQKLVETISGIHPEHKKVENSLPRMARFMKKFDTVLSLNYDFLVYWAMLAGNDEYGSWFKDCFVKEDQLFEYDIEFLRTPCNAEGSTLVFYPHGSLILAENIDDEEVKLCKGNQGCLLDTVTSLWESGYYFPLFVSEGTTQEKMRAIRQSPYLDFVYHYLVEDECDSLVIYGWSVKDEDYHIIKALVKGGFKKVAISVHLGSDSEEYCDNITHKFDKIHKAMHAKYEYTIKFFESSSEGCWVLC